MSSKRISLVMIWFISLSVGLSLTTLIPSNPVQSQIVEIR